MSRRTTGFRRIGLSILACVAIAFASGACSGAPRVTVGPAPSGSLSLGGAEQKVLTVLAVIDRTGQAPAGYRGGTQFVNDGRGGGEVLPTQDASGNSITYREWDVNPYTGANRGAERLVTGSDGSAWYTSDHYTSFVRIR